MAVQDAVAVRCLDHSVVPVMDLWRAEQFYTQALDGAMFMKVGMTFEWASGAQGTGNFGTFVKLGRSHLGLFLQRQTRVHPPAAPEAGYPCWGLAVAEEDFAAVVERARAAGATLAAEGQTVDGPRGRRSVRLLDSEGNALELVADAGGRYAGRSVTGLAHLRFEALDLAASATFYEQVLGLAPVDEGPDWLALAIGSDQCLYLHRVAALSPATLGPYSGRHFAFHVTHESFQAIVGRLRAAGIAESDINLPRRSDEAETYFYDPSGHWLQITTEDSAAAGRRHVHLRYAVAE